MDFTKILFHVFLWQHFFGHLDCLIYNSSSSNLVFSAWLCQITIQCGRCFTYFFHQFNCQSILCLPIDCLTGTFNLLRLGNLFRWLFFHELFSHFVSSFSSLCFDWLERTLTDIKGNSRKWSVVSCKLCLHNYCPHLVWN